MAFLCCQMVVEFSVGIGAVVIGLSQISFPLPTAKKKGFQQTKTGGELLNRVWVTLIHQKCLTVIDQLKFNDRSISISLVIRKKQHKKTRGHRKDI